MGEIKRYFVKKIPVTEDERERIDIGFNEYISQIALDIYNRYLDPDGFCRSTCFKYAYGTNHNENDAVAYKKEGFRLLTFGIAKKINDFLVNSEIE